MNRKTGFTLPELLGVLVIIAVVAAVLYPVWQKPSSPPNGAVQDSFGKPIPGATLHFRDAGGRVIAAVTTDQYGSFRAKGLDVLAKGTVDGYGLTKANRRTGDGDLYTFTPLGTQIARFCDSAGKPVPGLVVNIEPARGIRQWSFCQPVQQISDQNGVIQIGNVPLGGRFQFETQNPAFVIAVVRTIVSPNAIQYNVTVTPPATIAGRVLSANGLPLRGYKAFASLGPDFEHHDRYYARWLVTGAAGQFEIDDLPPGTYYVRAASVQGYQAVTPVQRVVASSGQTVNVDLRATGSD